MEFAGITITNYWGVSFIAGFFIAMVISGFVVAKWEREDWNE